MSCLLTLCCWLPGVLHALVVIHTADKVSAPMVQAPRRPRSRPHPSMTQTLARSTAGPQPTVAPGVPPPDWFVDSASAAEAPEGSPIRSVLAVSLPASPFRRIEPLLRQARFDVDRVPDAAGAVDLLQSVAFDVVILAYPLDGPSVTDLLSIIRRQGSPCQRSAVLIFAPENRVDEAQRLIGSGSTRVVSLAAPTETLAQEISALLRRAPRLSVRMAVRVQPDSDADSAKTLGQTDNVSSGGMLVRARRRQFPVNSLLRFELDLPDDPPPITGLALVVRHTQEDGGGLEGVGVQFMNFDDDGRLRLLAYIDRALSSETLEL